MREAVGSGKTRARRRRVPAGAGAGPARTGRRGAEGDQPLARRGGDRQGPDLDAARPDLLPELVAAPEILDLYRERRWSTLAEAALGAGKVVAADHRADRAAVPAEDRRAARSLPAHRRHAGPAQRRRGRHALHTSRAGGGLPERHPRAVSGQLHRVAGGAPGCSRRTSARTAPTSSSAGLPAARDGGAAPAHRPGGRRAAGAPPAGTRAAAQHRVRTSATPSSSASPTARTIRARPPRSPICGAVGRGARRLAFTARSAIGLGAQ